MLDAMILESAISSWNLRDKNELELDRETGAYLALLVAAMAAAKLFNELFFRRRSGHDNDD
jgi:hypothetical protein